MKLNIEFYKNFNNYYNRTLKYYSNISDYPGADYILESFNFNPNDGISTVVKITADEFPECDYAVVVDAPDTIVSRWFVIETVYNGSGLYYITLKRDVLADRWDKIKIAPMYIEKATLAGDNALIFNQEDISVNQIKKSEERLTDSSKCAWVCGFLARDYQGNMTLTTTQPSDWSTNYTSYFYMETLPDKTVKYYHVTGTSAPSWQQNKYYENKQYEITASVVPDITVSSLSSWEYYKYIGNTTRTRFSDGGVQVNIRFNLAAPRIVPPPTYQAIACNPDGTLSISSSSSPTSGISYAQYGVNMSVEGDSYAHNWGNSFKDNLVLSSIQSYIDSYITESSYDANARKILDVKGKIIYDQSANKFYRINVSSSIDSDYSYFIIDKDVSGEYLSTYINNKVRISHGKTSTHETSGTTTKKLKVMLGKITLTLTEEANGLFNIKMPFTDERYHLKDAPWDMFCIPYSLSESSNVTIKNSSVSGFTEVAYSQLQSIAYAQGIAEVLGSNIYDVELLPYCPISGFDFTSASSGIIDIKTTDVNAYTKITKGSTAVGYILWANSSSGTFNITKSIYPENIKMSNQCDKYRLCSGNYNGQFEFNLAMNVGIDYFNVDYTYLPYSSYIHVNPNFRYMYGADYDDSRGLICQGDFSIGYLSDNWANYQINNKNYLNTFNREIQHMEANQKYQRIQATLAAVAGGIGATAAGAKKGADMGVTPWGKAIGGAIGATIGAAAGVAGGVTGVEALKAMQRETLDYTKDMFNYNLQNIQAVPDSIAKTTAYTKNNKIVPVLEYYTCTDVEKTAVANKIAFNGMTVNVIGKIEDYINNSWSYGTISDKGYIKGKIIRFDEISEDTHFAMEVADELNKGVYTKS